MNEQRLERELDSNKAGVACELLGASLEVLRIQPGDIVQLKIPAKGNRWSMPRINKLAGAVRKRGGELAVIREDTSLAVAGCEACTGSGCCVNSQGHCCKCGRDI